MLSLIVTRCDGNPLATEVRGKFGVLGGTIGAIEGNTLVLDDPKGRVAPLEANIIASPRGYVIRNCAEAPLHVNATPVANSAEASLAPGDERQRQVQPRLRPAPLPPAPLQPRRRQDRPPNRRRHGPLRRRKTSLRPRRPAPPRQAALPTPRRRRSCCARSSPASASTRSRFRADSARN
jgi:hypothetical protein